MEGIGDKENVLQQEIVKLNDTVNGKDQAIKVLSAQVTQTTKENQRLKEMMQEMKNRIILENCFHTTFAGQKVQGQSLFPIKNNMDLTIGFVKDPNDEDEYFIEFVMKTKNPKTGVRDAARIPIEDVDEIEHIEGTLQFYIHYQADPNNTGAGVGGFLRRKM